MDQGRSAIIQLGPVVSLIGGRTVPPYLSDVPFDDPRMIRAFAAFWDRTSQVLASPEYNNSRYANNTYYIDEAQWIISIGNEIDEYLDAPASIDGPTADDAWAKYAKFYAKAARYVRGLPVDFDDDGIAEPNTSSKAFLRQVTFTTYWERCSPGWQLANTKITPGPSHSSNCSELKRPVRSASTMQSFVGMIRDSDYWTYTLYPAYDYGKSTTDTYATYRSRLDQHFSLMRAATSMAPFVDVQVGAKPIVLQEVGFPSGLTAFNDRQLETQQAAFVDAAFDSLVAYNSQWAAPGTTAYVQTYATTPRIASFNWFMLHDFSDTGSMTPISCPAGFDTDTCSWGLIDSNGDSKSGWAEFQAKSASFTPSSLDPVRSCPPGSTTSPTTAKLGPPYPIVLAHGMFGYQDFAGTDYGTYFYDVKNHLAANGEPDVYTPNVDAFGTSEHRGGQLAIHVKEILAQTGYAKVNLIGHSQGGLDARVVAHDYPDLVASVVTIATPHAGSPVADLVLDVAPTPSEQSALDEFGLLVGGPVRDALGKMTSFSQGMQALTTSSARAFNARYPDAQGVRYFSFAGRSNLSFGLLQCQAAGRPSFVSDWDWTLDTINPALAASAALLVLGGDDNDGFVPVKSAKWGTFLGCLPSDHLDEIGQVRGAAPGLGNTWQYERFYAGLVKFLRDSGY